MKRQLLITALLAAPLYLRQREVERRQRLWRRGVEADLRRYLKASSTDLQSLVDRLVKVRQEEAGDLEKFVKEVNRELSRAGRP